MNGSQKILCCGTEAFHKKSTCFMVLFANWTYGGKNFKCDSLWGKRGQKLSGKEHEGTFWGDSNVPCLKKGLRYTGMCICWESAKVPLKTCAFYYM